jgi:hypothetical protein
MRRWIAALGGAMLLAAMLVAPASAAPGAGELVASFNAGFTGGEAILFNDGRASMHAAPGFAPEGRLSPFGDSQVCDELLVGTWFYGFGEDNATGDIYEVVSYTLDGEQLDVVETPAKPIASGPDQGFWWIAAGQPVIGVLDPGTHVIRLVVDAFGQELEFEATVEVDAAHC